MSYRALTQGDLYHVLRKRTPYRVTTRPGCVVAWLDPWHGVIVRPGKRPTVIPTIPGTAEIVIFVLATFLSLGLFALVFPRAKSEGVAREIRDLFRRELGVKY